MFNPLRHLSPLRYGSLLWQFARRDVLARYRGSVLGLAWSLITPLLMLAVYTFVFREVFKARWPTVSGGGDGNAEFALQVYAGLVIFNVFSEVVGRAPRLVLEQPNLVKKVIFPLEILPWVAVLASVFHLLINLAVLLAATLVTRGGWSSSLFALPLVLLACLPWLLGITAFLASLGVFLRDIGQLMAMVMMALMFLSPVFFPASALPPSWQTWSMLNPMAVAIEQVRRVVLAGMWPEWGPLALFALTGLVIGWCGTRWFAVTRRGFADVL